LRRRSAESSPLLVVLSIFFVILLQKSSRKNENISPFLPGGGVFSNFIIFMYKKNIAVYNNKKEETNERAVLCARVCVSLSLSLFFLCAQYVYKSGNAKKNGAQRKKRSKKKSQTRGVRRKA